MLARLRRGCACSHAAIFSTTTLTKLARCAEPHPPTQQPSCPCCLWCHCRVLYAFVCLVQRAFVAVLSVLPFWWFRPNGDGLCSVAAPYKLTFSRCVRALC